MRDVAADLTHPVNQRRQPRQCAIHLLCQMIDIIPGLGQRNAGRQIALCHAVHRHLCDLQPPLHPHRDHRAPRKGHHQREKRRPEHNRLDRVAECVKVGIINANHQRIRADRAREHPIGDIPTTAKIAGRMVGPA
ncbi:hypothetical protein GALL_548710 [mine drainage metagenome]|uniref:Uncharacterized protein n=1 Tax=mine drainage metagenome TaxID=410659 RepID=A0A1J5PEC6_9ZZZZ